MWQFINTSEQERRKKEGEKPKYLPKKFRDRFKDRSRNNDVKVLCQEVSELHLIGKKFCVDISATGLSNDFEKFGKCRVQELRGHSNPTIAFFRLQRQIDQNGNVKGLCSLCPIYQKQFSIRSTM